MPLLSKFSHAQKLDPGNLDAVVRHFNKGPAFRNMKARCAFRDKQAEIYIDKLRDFHRGGSTGDSVNGAVIAWVCDAAVGMCLFLADGKTDYGSAVGRLDIRMRKPVEGRSLKATSYVKERKRNLIYAQVKITDERGNLCAECTGTCFLNTGAQKGGNPRPI